MVDFNSFRDFNVVNVMGRERYCFFFVIEI